MSFLFGIIAYYIQLFIRKTIWLVTIIEDFSLRKLWRSVSGHSIELFVWVLVFNLVFLPLYLFVFLLLDQFYGRKRGALLYSLVGVVLCFIPTGIFLMGFQHPPNFFNQFKEFKKNKLFHRVICIFNECRNFLWSPLVEMDQETDASMINPTD
jgi:hypothetical protein